MHAYIIDPTASDPETIIVLHMSQLGTSVSVKGSSADHINQTRLPMLCLERPPLETDSMGLSGVKDPCPAHSDRLSKGSHYQRLNILIRLSLHRTFLLHSLRRLIYMHVGDASRLARAPHKSQEFGDCP